jgi:hypothetical protein
MKKITGIELLIIAIVHSESDFIELHKRDEEMISKCAKCIISLYHSSGNQ